MEEYIQKFENIDKEILLDVLNGVVWYNGLYNFLLRIKYEIEKNIGIDEVGQYTLTGYENRHEYIDGQEEIFWMILVLLFGDYGGSPRRGWLYIKNKDAILKFLDAIIE